MSTVISVENLSKSYRLGSIGGGTLASDLSRWWARLRGQPDPVLKIGQTDRGNRNGEYIWALHDVSFNAQQGEAVGIIGHNGAGKSTLLKILSQVTAPTSGVVKVKGRIASLLEVGTGFHPELTGRENIFLNGAILGMSRIEVQRKFDEIVDFSGVEKYIDTPVKRYSSGMYVRLAFAVAAHLEPDILIVDEVLAVGDFEFQKKCLGKMDDVSQKEGRTILFVSHNMGAIRSLCASSLLLKSGSIFAQGLTNDIVQLYLSGQSDRTPDEERDFSTADTTGELRVVHVELESLDSRVAKDIFMPRCRFDIVIEFELRESIDVIWHIGITTLGETTIWASEIFDAPSSQKSPGMYKVKCRIFDLALRPGGYIVRLIARGKDGHVIQRFHSLADFQIVPPGDDSLLISTSIVYFDHQWSLE